MKATRLIQLARAKPYLDQKIRIEGKIRSHPPPNTKLVCLELFETLQDCRLPQSCAHLRLDG